MLQEASTCSGPTFFFLVPWALSFQFPQCNTYAGEWDLFEVSGGDSVMVSSSSSTASARVAIAVVIALQSVNICEALRCQTP